jgi:hypothetical protein
MSLSDFNIATGGKPGDVLQELMNAGGNDALVQQALTKLRGA